MSNMKDCIAWITDAVATKNLVRQMTHYRVDGREIRATDGRLTASHPFPYDGSFLVPGAEFEKLVKRMPDDSQLVPDDYSVTIKSGRSKGTIKTLQIELWNYPGVAEEDWRPFPKGLIEAMRKLRPFVSDNATQLWAVGISLCNGYAFATNNVALAGTRCEEIGDINAIVPLWAVDFLLDRTDGLTHWAWQNDRYVAFKWDNGAWMRSTLINEVFPPQAVEKTKEAETAECPQEVTGEFRKVFTRTVALCDGLVTLSHDTIGGVFGEAQYEDGVVLESLENRNAPTMWAVKFLGPVMDVATHWSPASWPKPAPFRGDNIFGFVVGRQG